MTLTGTAVDSEGNPITNAKIAVFLSGGAPGTTGQVKWTTTDANGVFTIQKHKDGTGKQQAWHIVGEYDDGTRQFNAFSQPSVTSVVDVLRPDSVDDYEDGDLTEWTPYGDTLEISSTTVESGSYSLRLASAGDANFSNPVSMPGDGLEYYPSLGDDWSFTAYHGQNNSYIGMYFFVQENAKRPKGYQIYWNNDGGNFEILRIDQSGKSDTTTLESVSAPTSTQKWHHIECLTENDGSFTATLYDGVPSPPDTYPTELASVTTTLSTYSSGGVAFDGPYNSSSGSDVFVDGQ